LRKVDWKALGALLVHLQAGWAVLGWALTGLLIAGLAFRWRIFLRQQKIELPFTTVLALTWAGQFFNSILPGSTGGDVVKIYQVCRLAPDRKAAATATVFVDRLAALLALLVLAGTAFVIDPIPLRILSIPSPSATTFGWLLLSLLLVAGALFLLLRTARSSLWGGRVIRTLAAARNNLSLDRGGALALLMAFALHLLNFFICYIFAKALGLSISYVQIAIMIPVVLFFVLLPITINGHGLRELLLIGYFTQMNITVGGQALASFREMAVAFSLPLVTNDLSWSIPGGIWYVMRYRSPERLVDGTVSSDVSVER